jgi:cytochrome c oxidase subunit IV
VSTTTHDPVEAEEAKDQHGTEPGSHEHPSDWVYAKIAIILGVITAAEIALYFVEDELNSTLVITSLLAMMVAKFVIVGSYFMHLKYDDPIFKRVFYFGLLLALAVYLITMTSMELWSDEGFFRFLRD